jgi:hypothetical protein
MALASHPWDTTEPLEKIFLILGKLSVDDVLSPLWKRALHVIMTERDITDVGLARHARELRRAFSIAYSIRELAQREWRVDSRTVFCFLLEDLELLLRSEVLHAQRSQSSTENIRSISAKHEEVRSVIEWYRAYREQQKHPNIQRVCQSSCARIVATR